MSRFVMLSVLCMVFLTTAVSADNLIVPDHYPLILDAMFFADPGDTVLLRCGIYYEHGIEMKPGVTLMSETGQLNCASIHAENLGGILSCVDCGDSTAIIGLRLSSGYMTSGYGAGISCTRSDPWLENLEFVFCQVRSPTSPGGGGLGCLDSSPTLINCSFVGCVLQESTVGGGGAMVTLGQSSPTLNDVIFETNWTT